jgi:hypothetical protein
MTQEQIINGIISGVQLTGSAAAIAAPTVAVFNPAAGALLVLSPLVEKFIVSELGMVIQFKVMTVAEQIAALQGSKFTDVPPVVVPAPTPPLLP